MNTMRAFSMLGLVALASCSSDGVDTADDSLAGNIVFRGASHASSQAAPSTSLVLHVPQGTLAGDVELAAVDADNASISAPAGWTRVTVATASTLTMNVFTHVASSTDPASFSFALSASRSVAGVIASYGGVSHQSPIDDIETQSDTTATSTPRAPAVNACRGGEMIVTIFANVVGAPKTSTWAPPTNQNERADVTTSRTQSGTTNVSLELDDLGPKSAAGTYGSYGAQSSAAGIAIAAALTLLPAGAACGGQTGDAGALDASTPDAITSDAGASASISVKSSTSKSGATSVAFASGPSTTTSGDYLVAQVVVRDATGASAPDGTWTKLGEQQDGSGVVYQAIYGKPASSAAAGVGTWSASGASSLVVTLSDLSGVNVKSPVHASASAGTSNALTADVPALSGTSNGDLELVFVASNAGPRPWADQGTLFGVIPSGSVPAKWVDQASLHTFEKFAGRKMAFGHSWLPWSFGGGFPASSATGPNSDFVEGRMSTFSWPAETTWPDGGGNGNGDPTTTLSAIASGKYDSILAANAQVLRAWKHPAWFRLFCEMNGGDHPWEVGHQTSPSIASSGAAAAYQKAFIGAWRRIWIITKGTPQDATNAGMSITTFAHADNVLFHFNPQTYQTTSQVPREALWPDDHYVDAVGTELYMRSSAGENTFDAHMTDTSSGNGTHQPLYATFGPSGSLNQTWNGLLGNGEGGNGGISGSLASMLDASKGLAVRTQWKFFTYWNGGTSTIDNQSATAQNDLHSFATDAWMSPTLLTTFDIPPGFTPEYQSRNATGAAGVNYGMTQSGAMLIVKSIGGASVVSTSVRAYGFGESSVIAIAAAP